MREDLLKYVKKGETCAIIPARSGSKGVPNKNIRSLKGFPMIAYSIAACKLSKRIDRILVSTDSEYYASIARYYGAEVPFIRPSELARDNSTDLEFMEHAISWLGENEESIPELFVHIRPTYPLRDFNVINDAIEIFRNDGTATSLRSAHKSDAVPYKWFNYKEGYFVPMWDDMTLDETNNPRQAFPDVYIPDGYVDILSSENIIKTDKIHGDKMIGFIVPDGVDVDLMKDMDRVVDYVEHHDHPIYEYLKNNYKTLSEWEHK